MVALESFQPETVVAIDLTLPAASTAALEAEPRASKVKFPPLPPVERFREGGEPGAPGDFVAVCGTKSPGDSRQLLGLRISSMGSRRRASFSPRD
jgi:hypothetical protein